MIIVDKMWCETMCCLKITKVPNGKYDFNTTTIYY